jgi:hypothetical protein
MLELSEVEDRLGLMFRAVARQVPDGPVTTPAPLAPLHLVSGEGADAERYQGLGGEAAWRTAPTPFARRPGAAAPSPV